MSWNDKLKFLHKCFDESLSSDPETRCRGETQLSEAFEYINYGITLIEFATESHYEKIFRETVAINFRSHVKTRWTLLFIAGEDFTTTWSDVIDDLGIRLQKACSKSDLRSMNGLLDTVDRLIKTICDHDRFTLDASLEKIKNFAAQFAEFFIPIFSSISNDLFNLGWFPKSQHNLKPFIEAQMLCYRILNSLFNLGVSDIFMDIKDEWIIILIRDLKVKIPVNQDGFNELMILADRLCTIILKLIIDLMETKLDMFIDQYLMEFVTETLNLLAFSSESSSRDGLTVVAMKFLDMLVIDLMETELEMFIDQYLKEFVYETLNLLAFSSGSSRWYGLTVVAMEFLTVQLCKFIVIPNVMLRKEHEEMFNLDHREFINKDMEGGGLDRRRNLACQLVNVTDHRYKTKVLEIVSTCLDLYNQDPDTFGKHKECTISLLVSLAEKGADGSAFSCDRVAVENFLSLSIIPELRSQDISEFSLLKAGALKFFIVFRNQILKPTALTLIPDVVRLLNSDSNVVHSYAATCVEKLLRVKGDGAYTAVDIRPYLMELTCNLFKALEKKDSEENKYVMACIMRVLGVVDISDEFARRCLSRLALVFKRVCEHPKNSVFNCYLFEAVTVLLKRAFEFVPYALQLLSQLVELNNAPISSSYMKVFDALMSSDSSKRPESVHRALAQLLQSFLEKAPHLLKKEMWLGRFLLIVNELVRSPESEEEWFYVLNTIIENFEYDVLEPHMVHIWTMIFSRVRAQETEKLCKCIVIFMSLFLVKYGSKNFVLSTNAAEPGLFIEDVNGKKDQMSSCFCVSVQDC
ncbi:Importin N-terminal domain-containing protein [Heracleum sosnowskyi]|uniref:Importin N-terminal domain-containing protein n=1 Tax=Heracleum sosnowskyi TaxID=360622 RepID=A0AAD8I8B1_9APIA|nr:Importin N-terminal domain-containing protein [Heracleum sosnowskyi]